MLTPGALQKYFASFLVVHVTVNCYTIGLPHPVVLLHAKKKSLYQFLVSWTWKTRVKRTQIKRYHIQQSIRFPNTNCLQLLISKPKKPKNKLTGDRAGIWYENVDFLCQPWEIYLQFGAASECESKYADKETYGQINPHKTGKQKHSKRKIKKQVNEH